MVGHDVYCELSEDPVGFTGILDRKGNAECRMFPNYNNSETAFVKLSTFNQVQMKIYIYKYIHTYIAV